MSSIYRKLVVYFLVLNLFAIGSVGIYSYYKEKEALLSRTFDQLISVRQEKKNRIITFFRQRIKDMENIALMPDILNVFSTASGNRNATGLPALDSFSSLAGYLKNAGCYQKLMILPDTEDGLWAGLKSENGKLMPLRTEEKQALQKFQKVLGNGRQAVLKEIHFSGKDTRPALVIGRNIFDNTGHRKGVLVLEIKPEAVNAIMFENSHNNGLGKTGEVYLVGSDGLMRSNSRFLKNSAFKTSVETPGELRALKGITGEMQFRDYRNIPVLSAYSPLMFSGIRWAVLAEIDAKEAMIPIYSIRDNIIYLSLLIALISAAIITFLSRKFSEPIKKLKDGTTQIASGKYGSTIAVEANDEIGELTRSFNEMSVRLKVQADRLEAEKKLRLRSVLDAQEEERQRLSRELHDGLGPLLLSGKMKLESAMNAENEALKKTTNEVLGLFSDTVQEIRNISNNMRPSGLKEFGLSVALQDFCQQIMENYPVNIHFLLDLKKDHYEKTVEIYLFRIAQEAVNNVLKHAEASEIHLTIEEIDNHLFFTLLDDGCGFDQKSLELHRGNGLLNMKERVNLLNGYFELTTAPGKGTRIDIDIPLL
jgi:signal transduction histidine kinase